ncbi:MAG: hypothetical protein J5601_01980, partial [Elusimicrobiaceae bacterium]|nr:hypothetical protein [Elusimicrobiaceae bacterium]
TGMVQEQMAGRAKNWELYTAVAPVLQRYIYIEQIPITENSILATKGMMERAPHFVNAISVVSLSEWMAQHDFMFPSIGIDPDLNVILAGLTRKTLNHELSTEASQFLLDCYLYAANAHDIDKVMRGITNFYKQHHRIPGLGRLAITKEHSIKFYKAFNAGTIELSSQELGEMNQAIPAIFLAYHLPGHPLWQKLPEETRNRVMEVRRTIESQLKPTRDPSQEFPQERK